MGIVKTSSLSSHILPYSGPINIGGGQSTSSNQSALTQTERQRGESGLRLPWPENSEHSEHVQINHNTVCVLTFVTAIPLSASKKFAGLSAGAAVHPRLL